MLFWSCCAPAPETSSVRYDLDTCEVLPCKALEPPTSMPSILTSRPNGPVQVSKLMTFVEEVEVEDPIRLVRSTANRRKCTRLSEKTGAKTEAKYVVDADLLQLVVETIGEAGQLEKLVCPIKSIDDIFTIEDGEDCFPSGIMDSLAREEKARIFLIVYPNDDSRADPSKLFLMEASQSARDDLLHNLQELSCS